MKQLTIICFKELSNDVAQILSREISGGYVHIPDAVGRKTEELVGYEKTASFPAEVFIAAAEDETIGKIVHQLKEYTDKCEYKPCLKMLVSKLEEWF